MSIEMLFSHYSFAHKLSVYVLYIGRLAINEHPFCSKHAFSSDQSCIFVSANPDKRRLTRKFSPIGLAKTHAVVLIVFTEQYVRSRTYKLRGLLTVTTV